MKRVILGFLWVATLCASGGENPITHRFELCQPLITQPEKGERGRIHLSGEVFDQARNVPSDLRLLDDAGTQWPFFIQTPIDRTLSKKRTPQILNKAWVGGAMPHWAFDLVLSEDDQAWIHNGLEIETTGNDFVRRIEISRDASGGASAHLGSGYLIRFPENREAKNRRVTYPDSDASRLHVRVYSNAKNADEHFDIQTVSVSCWSQIEAERQAVPATSDPVSEKESDEREQPYLLDTGFKNRPVEFITFDVSDSSFVRQVSVQGRNEKNDPWRWVGSGEIHRLDEEVETTITLRATTRWLKIKVRKNDNQPLDIQKISLEATPRNLVFEAGSTRPARLCFRGWDIPSASYDLKRRVPSDSIRDLPLYETGPTIPNPEGGSPSFLRKYSSLLSSLAVGLVGVLTLWVIIRMMRHPPGIEE